MGTDIHLSWQIRKNGKWEVVERVLDSYGNNCLRFRNYDNFALLAGVRQGYGDIQVPIVPLRGFPSDMAGIEEEVTGMSEEAIVLLYEGYIYGKFGEYTKERPDAWLGDHSFTWMSLSDMSNYPHWFKIRNNVGYITEEEKSNLPSSEACPVFWFVVPMGQATCRHEWQDCLAGTSYIYKEVFPAMEKLAQENNIGPDDVRVVMGFDS